jgi:tripartite ATP-independent transporter DctP family solute receptor
MKLTPLLFGIALAFAVLAWIIFSPTLQPPVPEHHNSHKEETMVLRFGHNTPTQSALHQAALRFADEIKVKSQGRVEIQIFPAQELGNDHQMVEMARNGELDIILTPTAKMSVPVPSMQYADLPFFFPSREDVYAMLDGEPGQMLLEDLRKIGLVGVTFWENGFKHFTGNTPFLSPDDFQGKKIRVMKSRMIMDQFNSFGAEAVAIDFHSTKRALLDKVVDGQENPLVAIVSMGFHEVQSDLTISEHAYLGYVFSISEKVFATLPQDLRFMLVETAKEVTPWEREETQKREQKLIETIESSGVAVHKLSDANRQKFAEKTAHIPREYEEVIGADIISKTQELLLEKYGPDPKEKAQIVIGIDADLSMDGKTAGLDIKRGVDLAVDEINAKGGLLGKKLVVLAKDHRSVSSIGVQNIQEFARREDLVAIIGGLHGAVIADEIETIQENKIPYLVPWATSAEIIENGHKENYLFRVSANDRYASVYIADFALKHYKHPAIIVENSIWGRKNLERMTKYLHEKGVYNAASIVFNRGQKSFQKELAQIRSSGADSIIMVANSNEASLIVQEDAKQRSVLPVIAHWGVMGGDFFQENEKIVKNIDFHFLQTFSFSQKNTPHCQQLASAYLKRYDKRDIDEIKAAPGVAQAHDLVHLLALAIEKAQSTDRKEVKEALENLSSYKGVIKEYSPAFTPDRHDALGKDDFHMATMDSDGKIIAVGE